MKILASNFSKIDKIPQTSSKPELVFGNIIHKVLQRFHEKNKDLNEALHYAERTIALNPAPHIMDTLGWVYYHMGRLIEALKIIEEASRELSEVAVIFEHLGDIHLSLGNLEQARTAFERSLQLAPDNDKLREKLDTLADSL